MSARVTPAGTLAPDHVTPGSDLPAFLAEDTAAREWLSVYDHGSRTRSWHPTDVEWTLKQAHRLLRRIGSRVGPASGKGFWPAIVREHGDWSEETKRRRATASEVSSMNAALGWVWGYLAHRENERHSVQAWAFCEETGVRYTTFLREAGKVRATEQLRRRRGLLFIAAGLCRDDVRIPREVLLARLERPVSDVRAGDEDALAVAAQHAPDSAAEPPEPVYAPTQVIADFWRDCSAVQGLPKDECGNAVLALISDRVRHEAAGGLIPSAGPALTERQSRLADEAMRRGLLPAGARRTLALSREQLSAKIQQKREGSNVGEG